MPTFASRPADTAPEDHRRQTDIYREMSGEAKIREVFRLNGLTRALTEAGIRARHPGYGEREVLMAFVQLCHGSELAREVWPDCDLPRP